MTTTVAPVRDATGVRTWRIDAALLALGALAVRLPAFLAPRHLTFDDGQYGSAVLAMRDGAAPFRDLFSSQGPLHYPALWLADLLGFRTLDGPRLEPIVAGALASVAAYAIARRITSRGGALVAGALVATSGSVLYVTGPLSGDGPALALVLGSVALAFRYREGPTPARAALIGALAGAAVAVKLLVLPAVLVAGLLVLGRRRLRECALAAAAVVAVPLAAALPWGVQRVWDQSVAYHRNSERLRSYGGNLRVLVQTLAERDPFVVAAVGLALAGFALRRIRSRGAVAPEPETDSTGQGGPTRLLWVWVAAQTAFLVVEPAMWRPHVSQVIAPMALLAVLRPPPWRVLGVVVVVLVPWWIANTHEILWPDAYSPTEQAVVDHLRRLPEGAWVISDDPGFAWRAERRVPGDFVDVSEKRVQQHQLTARVIARAAASRRVCAVVVWSERRFGRLRSLPGMLNGEGYTDATRFGGRRAIYERADCHP